MLIMPAHDDDTVAVPSSTIFDTRTANSGRWYDIEARCDIPIPGGLSRPAADMP